MDTEHALLGAGLILAFGVAFIGLVAYLRFRGPRLVSCPVDAQAAAVRVNARLAALTALPRPVLRVQSCSLWPDRQHCGQLCLDAVEAGLGLSPMDAVLAGWYTRHDCALCGSAFRELRWVGRPPAVMDARGRLMHWYEVPLDRLAVVLEGAEYRPVCWECHLAETLRLEDAQKTA